MPRADPPARAARPVRLALGVLALGTLLAGGLGGRPSAWGQPGLARPATGGAPAVTFRHLTTDDGLSNNLVTAVVQDALGFVWAGTTDGLNRYDGYAVVEHRRTGDTTSVPDNAVQALAAGPGGVLWVGTGSGLARYDPATERFTRYRHRRGDPASLPNDDVIALAADTLGGVWVGTAGGLAYLGPDAGRAFETFRADPARADALPSRVVQAVHLAPGGAVWAGTEDGLARLDRASGAFVTYRYAPPEGPPAVNSVSALAPSERGLLWVGTLGGGLRAFDPATGAFTPIALGGGVSASVVSSVYEDREGTVWVSTFGAGLQRLAPGLPEPAVYRHSPDDPGSLADDMVSEVYEDRQGVLWAATYRGLDRFDRARGTYARYRHDPQDPATLASNTVRALLATRAGTVLVGTDRSLDRLGPRAPGVTRTAVPAPPGTPEGGVTALYEARDGTLWAGTPAGLARVPDPERPALAATAFPAEAAVTDLLEDEAGRFWVGTLADGLALYDRPSGQTVFYRHDPARPGSLAHNTVQALAPAPGGGVWAGTAAGLCRLDRADDVGQFACAQPGPGGLPSANVLALHARPDGTLYAGTAGGLARFDPARPAEGFRLYSEATSDLPGDAVQGIAEDAAGFLWLATNRGLARFDPVTETFQQRALDGAERTLGRAAARGPDGRLYFGGTNGVLTFYPEQLAALNPHPPDVVLTGVLLADTPLRPGPDGPLREAAPVAEAVHLRHNQDYLTFTFAALHFSDPAQNRYRFRLDGFDASWREAGRERKATYTNLDPGRYTFRVQAANADGVWSPEGAALRVVVAPPLWQRPWAYALYLLALGLAAYRLDRWQRRRLLGRERERAGRREAELRAEKAEAELARAREVQEANERLEASLHDLRATQSQLVQAEKLASLGQLTAGIAHEIKNPLNFVNNFADLSVDLATELGAELEGAAGRPVAEVLPDVRELLESLADNARRIREHGQRADRIVHAMLLHSRGGASEHARVPLNRFVEEYANLAYHGARANDAEFQVALAYEFDPEAGEVELVPQEMGRVLINLLTNAFYAVAQRRRAGAPAYAARVVLATRRVGDAAEIRVADNGLGIPARVRDRIFEPFFTTKPSGEGTGLGLSLAHDIVTHIHGGALEVESAEGEGTAFTLRLPVHRPGASAPGGGGGRRPERPPPGHREDAGSARRPRA